MKKCISILSALLLLCMPLNAGAVPTSSAKEVVESAVKALKGAKGIEATFTAAYGRQSAGGTIVISGGRFHLDTTEMLVWFDGHTQWAYSPSANEVNVSEPTFEELQQVNPFAIMQGLSKQYTPRRVAAPTGCDRVELTPAKGAKAQYSKVILTVNSTTRFPVAIDVTASDGSKIAIKITSLNALKSAPAAATFTFPAKRYPKAELIDLR